MQFKFKSDLKDFQIARLMYWGNLDEKTPIPKQNFEFIKCLRKHGAIVYCCSIICVVCYPSRFTFPNLYRDFKETDLSWAAINSEVLELEKDFIEEDNFEYYYNLNND